MRLLLALVLALLRLLLSSQLPLLQLLLPLLLPLLPPNALCLCRAAGHRRCMCDVLSGQWGVFLIGE